MYEIDVVDIREHMREKKSTGSLLKTNKRLQLILGRNICGTPDSHDTVSIADEDPRLRRTDVVQLNSKSEVDAMIDALKRASSVVWPDS